MKKKAQQNIVGTFKVNLNTVRCYDDSDKYLNLVQQEIENGNGFVKVKSMSGDKAEIYGAGSNGWVLGGVFVPFEALMRVSMADDKMKKEVEKPKCKVIEDRAKFNNEPQSTPLIERIPRTVQRVGDKKMASDQIINNVPDVPRVQGPVEESDAKPIKPRKEQMSEQKAKEVEKIEGPFSPEIIVEWAMRDAESNHNKVEDEIDRLADDYGLTDKQKEDAHKYYEGLRTRNQRDAAYLNKIIDEIGSGFSTFSESFKYMTMDLSKEDKYRLKRIARKAGLLSE